MDNGFHFLINDFSKRQLVIENTLPFNPLKNPDQMELLLKDNDGIQFSHTFDEQLDCLIQAGFIIAGAYEDYNNTNDERINRIPAFWATKAIQV